VSAVRTDDDVRGRHGRAEPDPVVHRVLAPSASLVLAMQAVRGYPCVSLLANTAAGESMSARDERRLRVLADRALDRLDDQGLPGHGSALARTLTSLIDVAAASRTGTAVAVLGSQAASRVVTLRVPVVERQVVDHTFATRDLVRSLHRTPRHVVLVLESDRARLLDNVGGELRPAATSAFPVHSPVDLSARSREEERHAFLTLVDRRLGLFRRLHPCPLIVLGHPGVVGDYLRVSENAQRLAGVLRTHQVPTSVDHLQERTMWLIASYLASREREALALLESRASSGQVASGVHAAWLAARRERPEMLAVEPGLLLPARLSPDGDTLTLVDAVGDPDVVDDIVDELIELVLARGGWVAFVEDGHLADHGGVALTLR
jgi:hypothetical protein